MRHAAKIYLYLMIAMNVVFGVLFTFTPARMTDALGYGALAAAAVTDIRATFGGYQLAAAAFLCWCLKPARLKIGLMFMLLAGLPFVVCRNYGLLIDGDVTPTLRGTALFEAAVTLAALLLYRFTPDVDAQVADRAPPRAAKIFLSILGALSVISGVYAALLPQQFVTPMGFDLLAPAALTDVRASYGGFQLGCGLFSLWCLNTARLHAGMLNAVLTLALIAACRVLGMLLDGAYTPALLGTFLFEATLTAIALVILARRNNMAVGEPA